VPTMPIPLPPINQPVVAKVAPDDYRHSVVDTKLTPFAALLTHIEGSNWKTDYYSQVLGGDEELSEYQPEQLAVYQQYHVIRNLILKLQGSLSISPETETSVMTITGSAKLYPIGLIPNRGDAFIADIGDGRAGQFTITESTPLTIMKERCYEISFTLARFATHEMITEIEQKVVKESYFQEDFLLYGQNPIISSEQRQAVTTLAAHERDLLDYWFRQFYSREFRTIVVPGQTYPTYDPYIVRAIVRMYNTSDHPNIQKLRILNVDGYPPMQQTDIWSAIMSMRKMMYDECFPKAHCISTKLFSDRPLYEAIRYSGMYYTLAPMENGVNVDVDYSHFQGNYGYPLTDIGDFRGDLASQFFLNILSGFVYPGEDPLPADSIYLAAEVPMIHPITSHDGYVFSPSFYEPDESMTGLSKLEVLVYQFITQQTVNRTVLYAMCESVQTWGRLERFFYTPVLLALLKTAQRTI